MAIEAKRGCGYRKVGGLYLCGSGEGMSCCKMPIILHVCPTCNGGIKQSRGWQWIDPRPWLVGDCKRSRAQAAMCPASPPSKLGDRVGLIWIGEGFYKTPAAFSEEANRMGISRRIQAVPRGFVLGEHWVFLAHPKMQRFMTVDPETGEETKEEWRGGVFRIFKPDRLEKLVTETQAQDGELMDSLAEAGITAVVVPDNDRDHQGSVYDDATEAADAPALPL